MHHENKSDQTPLPTIIITYNNCSNLKKLWNTADLTHCPCPIYSMFLIKHNIVGKQVNINNNINWQVLYIHMQINISNFK